MPTWLSLGLTPLSLGLTPPCDEGIRLSQPRLEVLQTSSPHLPSRGPSRRVRGGRSADSSRHRKAATVATAQLPVWPDCHESTQTIKTNRTLTAFRREAARLSLTVRRQRQTSRCRSRVGRRPLWHFTCDGSVHRLLAIRQFRLKPTSNDETSQRYQACD